jgi:Sec-independent protein translocase protein TatA
MEILGIGPLEFLFILLIALIVLGPGDMVKAGRTLGRFIRKVITSPEWRTVQRASRELRYLPNRLVREANMEDLSKDLANINKIGSELKTDIDQVEVDLSTWTTPPESATSGPHQPETENKPSASDSSETPIQPENPS